MALGMTALNCRVVSVHHRMPAPREERTGFDIPCVDGILSPQNSYVEALPPTATIWEDRAFKEVITVKRGHQGGVLIC